MPNHTSVSAASFVRSPLVRTLPPHG
jgi:hypothetical protein